MSGDIDEKKRKWGTRWLREDGEDVEEENRGTGLRVSV